MDDFHLVRAAGRRGVSPLAIHPPPDFGFAAIMIPNLYQGGTAPHYQWVDDLEKWNGFPSAGDNLPYARY